MRCWSQPPLHCKLHRSLEPSIKTAPGYPAIRAGREDAGVRFCPRNWLCQFRGQLAKGQLGGSVLIMTVWTLSLLSMLVVGIGARGNFALELTERMDEQLVASYIASAGLQQAIMLLGQDSSPMADTLGETWASGPEFFENQSFVPGYFTISHSQIRDGFVIEVFGLIDEDRYLNLNTISAELMRELLLEVGGIQATEARIIADSLLDWRDKDKDAQPYGAENFYYSGLHPPYPCKDGPFENVEELLLVRGMYPELFERIKDYVTVYGSGMVNIHTAPLEVLGVMGISNAGVNGIAFYRAGEDNKEGTADDRIIASTQAIPVELTSYVPVEDVDRLTELLQDDLLTVKSEDFRIQVTAWTQRAQYPLRVLCVVNRKGRIKSYLEETKTAQGAGNGVE